MPEEKFKVLVAFDDHIEGDIVTAADLEGKDVEAFKTDGMIEEYSTGDDAAAVDAQKDAEGEAKDTE